VKYRALGRQRFFTIGPHGSPWTPEKARKEAKRLLGLVAGGKDPAHERTLAALQATETLRKIADQYLKQAKQKLRPRTYYEIERYLLSTWKALHSTPVVHIRRRHIAARTAEIATGHGIVAAARARAALSAMFNWAIREGLDIAANPVLGTNRPAGPRARDRVLTDSELAEIWAALGDDDYGRIVKLLALTGQRRNEVGGMRWTEVDFDKAIGPFPVHEARIIASMLFPSPKPRSLCSQIVLRRESTSLDTARAARMISIAATLAGRNRRLRSMRGFTPPVRRRQTLAKKWSLCLPGGCMIFGARPPR
jgi:integrase